MHGSVDPQALHFNVPVSIEVPTYAVNVSATYRQGVAAKDVLRPLVVNKVVASYMGWAHKICLEGKAASFISALMALNAPVHALSFRVLKPQDKAVA